MLYFFFNDTATTEIYTLSLHDALPIYPHELRRLNRPVRPPSVTGGEVARLDRKSTRLNSSHVAISYAVFCLKKKKKTTTSGLRSEERFSINNDPYLVCHLLLDQKVLLP